jgi:hypothetical protein
MLEGGPAVADSAPLASEPSARSLNDGGERVPSKRAVLSSHFRAVLW